MSSSWNRKETRFKVDLELELRSGKHKQTRNNAFKVKIELGFRSKPETIKKLNRVNAMMSKIFDVGILVENLCWKFNDKIDRLESNFDDFTES